MLLSGVKDWLRQRSLAGMNVWSATVGLKKA